MGERIFALVQTGPRALQTFCTMGTGSIHGIKRPSPGANHPPTSNKGVEEKVELYL